MESKKETELVKRVSGSQVAPTPPRDAKVDIAPTAKPTDLRKVVPSPSTQGKTPNQLPPGMAPMAGQKGVAENSKIPKNISDIKNTAGGKNRPFDSKAQDGGPASNGILKNGTRQPTEVDTELSQLLGPSSPKKLILDANIQDDITNNWRNKKDRMELYNLQRNLSMSEIKTEWVKNLISWKKEDDKGAKKTLYTKKIAGQNDLILHVTEQSRIEKLANYEDRWPLLNFRKEIQRLRIKINESAFLVMKSKIFENTCMAVIGVNCYVLATTDPTAEFASVADERFDKAFLALYSIEMIIKIVALGFILNTGSYLRDPWNDLDFVIVASAWLTEIQTLIGGSSGNSLGALRAFRVLRPLKAVTTIKGLQVLVVAVLKSIPLLKDTFIILIFFFLIFAIAGLQLFSGLSHQTCLTISTGAVNATFYDDTPNQGFCGGANYCWDGDFCGQIIAAADYGTTNYDNILWGLLNVFVSITLEGWSEFMVKYQKTYTWLVGPLFFIPMSYLGGFFLLNLLLAVINSSFSSSNAVLQAKMVADAEKNKKKKKPVKDDDWKDPKDGEPILEIGTTEFFIAKRVAKKMIERLRTYQATKAADAEYLKEHPILDDDEDDFPPIPVQGGAGVDTLAQNQQNKGNTDQQMKQGEAKQRLSSDNILEELSDESLEHAEQVAQFLAELDREEKMNKGKKATFVTPLPPTQKFATNDMRVAQSKKVQPKNQITKIQTGDKIMADRQNLSYDNTKLDDLLDINKLLEGREGSEGSAGNPYDLSFLYTEQGELPNFSDDDDKPAKKQMKTLEDLVNNSAIASDSSFGDQIEQLKRQASDEKKIPQQRINPVRSAIMNEIKRRIKRIQIENKEEKDKEQMNETGQSTANAARNTTRIVDEKSILNGKTPNNPIQTKAKLGIVGEGYQAKKKAFLSIISNIDDTFLNQTKPKNPYEYIDKKSQKIEINTGMPYLGTSVDEVFEIKNLYQEANEIESDNKYILAGFLLEQNKEEPILESDDEYIKPQHDPYQLKTVYSIGRDEEFDPNSDDEEAQQLELQPFDTATSIGFKHLLSHKPIQFRTRRSDIIVSSTLQITLAPADGAYVPLHQALFTAEKTQDWCQKRHEFRALQVQTQSRDRKQPKDQNTMTINTETILKSIVVSKETKVGGQNDEAAQSQYQDPDEKIGDFFANKGGIIPPTLLQKPLPHQKLALLSAQEKRLYEIQRNKYDAFQRQIKKMEVKPLDIQFTLEDARLLSEGKYHEEGVDDDDDVVIMERNKTQYFVREENFYSSNLKDFETNSRQIAAQKKRFQSKYEKIPYIPLDLKVELNLPDDLQNNKINYNEILKKDCNRKRKTPHWSGQDILETGLNEELSEWSVDQLNAVRIWPKGLFGWVKKLRCFLKIIIKADWFSNVLMGAVLANTVVMALNSYGISAQTSSNLDTANAFFTWFFIVELAIKVFCIGPKKYIDDKMNWLDGSIVGLSLMDMILTAIIGSGGNLNALKSIRVLRTLRVLRVARLLRSLESMQMIISVFLRSATSFMYITMLLFVFLFIYTLLGMQSFGGCLNYNWYNFGKSTANFDTFLVAFYSAFQIMSAENWNNNVVDYMQSPSIPIFVTPIYLISWIFIGNYVLLNLFLAILLDSFLAEDGEEGQDLEELERLQELKRLACVEKEKIRRLKKLGASMLRTGNYKSKATNQAKTPKEIILDDVDDMDEDLIRDIFIQEGLLKQNDAEKEKADMYNGVYANKALYLFSKENVIRTYAYKLYKWKMFDNFIMFMIFLSSVKLALATYEKYVPDSVWTKLSDYFDIILNVIFLCECVTKNIALGFIMEEGSYIRDAWNQLDFFIVVTSMGDMMLSNLNIPAIKILRLLRTLRPLRVISHNVSMKLVVSALFESAGAIANVIVVVVACWIMFGIFGVSLFAGKFYFCNGGNGYTILKHIDMYSCENDPAGYTWTPWPENFDNMLQAMLVLFSEASTESWPDVMIRSLMASAVDVGPVFESNLIHGLYFILFMLIGNFFLMNFFTGVLFLKYEQASRREKKGFTSDQLAWVDIQKMILDATVPFEMQFKPLKHDYLRLRVWLVVTSNKFDVFIMAVIVANIGQMALYHQTAPPSFLRLLEYSNYMFTIVFCIEAGLKLFTYRLAYFKTAWNKFDFFVCCASLLDIGMSFMSGNQLAALKAGPQLARIMRVMRVTRIIKLAGKNEGLQALLATITLAIGPIMNVFILLVLGLFIFAVLGNFFLGEIDPSFEGYAFYQYKNFANFHLAFQTMFVITTGESWNYFMYDAWSWGPYCTQGYNCGSQYAPVYFICFVMLIQFVMLNLFALVVIDQFEMYYMSDDNPIQRFKGNYDAFQVTWIQMTMKYRGLKMREKQLFDFFRKLKPPIGLPEETTDNQIKKIMLKMGIRSDGGYVYFNELLYRCMRRQYGNFKLGKKLQIKELITQFTLYGLTLKAQNQSEKLKDHDLFVSKMIGTGKSVNPFVQMMYFRISFNTWRNYAAKLYKRKKHDEEMQKKKERMAALGRTFIPYEFDEGKQKFEYIMVEQEIEIWLTSDEEPADDNVSQISRIVPETSNKKSAGKSSDRYREMKKERSKLNRNDKSDISINRSVAGSNAGRKESGSEARSVQPSSKRSDPSAAKPKK